MKRFQILQLISSACLVLVIMTFNNCGPGFMVTEDVIGLDSNSSIDTSTSLGKSLYQKNCAACHGTFDSTTKRNRSLEQIKSSIQSIAQMSVLAGLSDQELGYIADALNGKSTFDSTAKYSCTTPNSRGQASKLRRLTRYELKNTLVSLIGDTLANQLVKIDRFTKDDISATIESFNPRHNFQQVDSIFELSQEIADLLTASSNNLAALNQSCLVNQFNQNSFNNTCIRSFITEFGERVHRRALDNATIDKYLSEFNAEGTEISGFTAKERLNVLIARIFQSPNMYFHIESPEGSPTGGRVKIDQFAVASRLSYSLTGTMPDADLFAAAKAGSLNSSADLLSHANRLAKSSAGEKHLREFASFWLRLDQVPSPNTEALARMNIANSGMDALRVREDVVTEAKDFVQKMISSNADFNTLMTSNLSYPSTTSLSKIMKVSKSISSVATTDGRLGVVGRPAIHLSNYERERPIHRGATIRERLLCDVIPPPPADADQAATDNLATIDEFELSSREVAAVTTQNSSCLGCHSQINPLGFVVGQFGPLGELREIESIYKNGELHKQLAINSNASNLNLEAPEETAANHKELAQQLAQSDKAQACIPKFFFELNSYRAVDSADSCKLHDMESSIRNGKPVIEALIEGAVAEDIFWKGTQ